MEQVESKALAGGVALREVREEDLPIFYEQQLDQEATRMAAFPARGREAFMAHWRRILANESILTRTILLNGEVAGNMVSFEQALKREVGYWLGKEFWGQGVATRALAAFLQEVKTRPLYAHVAKHNIASRRVLEKCGFKVVGEEKEFSHVDEEAVEGLILRLG